MIGQYMTVRELREALAKWEGTSVDDAPVTFTRGLPPRMPTYIWPWLFSADLDMSDPAIYSVCLTFGAP